MRINFDGGSQCVKNIVKVFSKKYCLLLILRDRER